VNAHFRMLMFQLCAVCTNFKAGLGKGLTFQNAFLKKIHSSHKLEVLPCTFTLSTECPQTSILCDCQKC